jgi:type IV secretion system protein TrbL
VALIAFKIGSLVAFVALPWGVFNGTSWVAERPLGWVVGSAMRLFVLALIASVAVNFVASLPGAFSLDDGGVLNVLLFGLTILALAWFGPQLASEVVQGQPHLSGADAVRAAIGATAVTTGGGMLVAGAARAGVRAVSSLRRRGGARSGRGGGGGGGGSRPAPAIDHGRFRPPRPPTASPNAGKKTS